MADARQMDALVKIFRDKCDTSGKRDGLLGESLRESFTELERCAFYTFSV